MKRSWHFVVLFFLTCTGFTFLSENVQSQNIDDEAFEVYLDFRHRGVINTVVIAYYKDDQFYLPISELFTLFQIDINSSGLVFSGKFSTEQTPYIINIERNFIEFGDYKLELTQQDYLLGELDTYFPIQIYSKVFGLNFSVDFNNLLLNLVSDNELPAIEKAIRARLRRDAQNKLEVGRTWYPLKEDRVVSALDLGFLDYSLSSSTVPGNTAFNYNTTLGFELLGGDVQGSLYGNYARESFYNATNGLRWRYRVRDTPWLSSVVVGQSNLDGVIGSNYTGIRIANSPIEPRRYFDEFEIQGNTIPQSEIEIYLNNSLLDYKQADELGNYRFLTPLFYGASQLDLRIYGPTGQIIERSSRIQIPFNFQPKGVLNYTINAGRLDNPLIGRTDQSTTLQASAAYGINNWLTSKLGVEYYENGLQNDIPALTSTVSARLSSNYIVTLEGVTNGYYRSALTAIYPNSASVNVDFTSFNQTTGIYNTSGNNRQLIASVFYPLAIGRIPLNLRASSFSRFSDLSDNYTVRLDLNSRINKLNFRFGYSDRLVNSFEPWSPTTSSLLESSATYTVTRDPNIPAFIRGSFIRSQIDYHPKLKQIRGAEVLISKSVFRTGRFQFSFGRNFMGEFNTVRFNFVIDFKKVRSNSTFSNVNNSYNLTQNIRGSIGYDSNYNNFLFTSADQVGRSGVAVKLFVDNDGNNKLSEGDDLIPEGNIRISRSGSQSIYKNGVLYYTQMQPYFRYNMELLKSSIKNPMLVPEDEKFSIITDPNTFKKIELPFYMSGVIDGAVNRFYAGGQSRGIGGLKVNLESTNPLKPFSKELRTFSDGSFYEYEVPPGEYRIYVDPSQLEILNSKSDPEVIDFEVQAIPEGDFVEGLAFNLIPMDSVTSAPTELQVTISQVTDEIKSSPEILEFSEETYHQIDDALRLIIKAQNAFYAKNLDLAFRYVNESLELFETAQAYALKGSFYYFEGNREQAQREWQMALRFNPDLYIPNMELLDERVTTSSSE